MLNYREKRTLLILSIISVVLSSVACIPFTLAKFTQAELIIKYIVLPVAIAILSIVCYSIKYRNYRPAYRFPTISGYLPVLSYSVALSINTLLVLLRSNQVYSLNAWIGIVVVLSFYVVGSIALIHLFMSKIVVFSKNEIMVVDSLFIAVLAIDAIAFGFIVSKFVGLEDLFVNNSWIYVLVPLVVVACWLAFHINHLVQLFKTDAELVLADKEELIAKYYQMHEDFYNEAYDKIVNALHGYSEEIINSDEDFTDEVVEEETEEMVEETTEEVAEGTAPKEEKEPEVIFVKDEAEAKRIAELEEAIEKINAEKEDIQESHLDDLADVKAEVEEAKAEAEEAKAEAEALKAAEAARLASEAEEAAQKAKEAAERAAAIAEAKKAIKPSFTSLVTYASSLDEEGTVVAVGNEKGSQFKFYYNKKLFLVLQDSNIDYRILFLSPKDIAIDLIINYPGEIVKAKSPKGPNWYKLTNKGTFEEGQLKQIIKQSLVTYKDMQAEAAAEKERIKQEKAAAKKAEREAAKAANK